MRNLAIPLRRRRTEMPATSNSKETRSETLAIRAGFEGFETQELIEFREEIDSIIESRRETEKSQRIEAILESVRAAGASSSETERISELLKSCGKPKRAPTMSPAKYRDPETGQTWTGRGRKANWVKEFEGKGGNLEDVAL